MIWFICAFFAYRWSLKQAGTLSAIKWEAKADVISTVLLRSGVVLLVTLVLLLLFVAAMSSDLARAVATGEAGEVAYFSEALTWFTWFTWGVVLL